MRIGIVTLALIEENQMDFYNPQSIGLGRAFAQLMHEVYVYSFEKSKNRSIKQKEISTRVELIRVPCKGIGTNSLGVTKPLDPTLDVIICFSDIQLAFKSLFKWCESNNIPLYPYIGVIKSRQENAFKRLLMNFIAERNIKIYRNQLTFAKTGKVKTDLANKSVDSKVATVGLDTSIMGKVTNDNNIRLELGFSEDDIIILFVGRLVKEKRPIELIKIFEQLKRREEKYKLCIIGQGDLRDKVKQKIVDLSLCDSIKMIESVSNQSIWQYYCMSSYFVNLNIGEIFGMAILEAMYYKCKVVARCAPGPEMIITNNVDGYLCKTDEDIVRCISSDKSESMKEASHIKVKEKFTWESTAKSMLIEIQKKKS